MSLQLSLSMWSALGSVHSEYRERRQCYGVVAGLCSRHSHTQPYLSQSPYQHSFFFFSCLPWTQSADLIETPVDDDGDELPSATRTRRAHSYNDYENYFYI
ncbi:hypothetical protein E2C01_013617 [Portunus trituberculatus]|uniref:Uncharacterized protein n=1 Tax=Portunus trituberculatus TaxID=210409 RepID=A0A5B7DHN7_PORTR|nr:hypothetical protein [Portunus trituberculatus]